MGDDRRNPLGQFAQSQRDAVDHLGQKEQLRHLRSDLESSDHLKNRSFLALVTD